MTVHTKFSVSNINCVMCARQYDLNMVEETTGCLPTRQPNINQTKFHQSHQSVRSL
jgi:hypothetical protein